MPHNMDTITKKLHTFLVTLGISANDANPQAAHFVEHIMHLLPPDDEDAVCHYYGIYGHRQMSIYEIAAQRDTTPEQMMAHIDQCLHRMAITPEWQEVRKIL